MAYRGVKGSMVGGTTKSPVKAIMLGSSKAFIFENPIGRGKVMYGTSIQVGRKIGSSWKHAQIKSLSQQQVFELAHLLNACIYYFMKPVRIRKKTVERFK